jgi:hypothetical protein
LVRKDEAELLPLGEDVVAPGELAVQVKTGIFDVVSCGKLYVVKVVI